MSDEVITETNVELNTIEICINRPAQKNALSHEMYEALGHLLKRYGTGEECTSIILYGAGGDFTAGADLRDFQKKRGPGDSPAVRFLRALDGARIPVIAAVEGNAIGIGTTLLQHCDLVYASEVAKFRLPFIVLGLCPEGGSSYLLERLVGARKARDWLLTGRFFDAQEAHSAGFLTGLTAAGDTLARARETAKVLSKLPHESVCLTKRMLDGFSKENVKEALDNEVLMYAECLAQEGTQKIIQGLTSKK